MDCLLDHIVLNVIDDEGMIDFYTSVLDLPAERLQAYRAGEVPFPSLRISEHTIIDLFPKKMWEQNTSAGKGRVNLNHFCLALSKSDWESLKRRLEENDIRIEAGPVPRWGAHGTGTSIYFRDPEDNLIEVRYYEGPDDSGKCRLGS